MEVIRRSVRPEKTTADKQYLKVIFLKYREKSNKDLTQDARGDPSAVHRVAVDVLPAIFQSVL